MAKHPASTKGLSHVTAADYVRLGPAVAAIKAKMSPARWHQVVKTAHDQGWTVESALDSNTPAALKQNTKSSLMKAAKRTVDTSFAPQSAELDAADTQNAGLRQKRLSDQSAYDQWSSQKASELAGSVNAAQAKYLDTIKQSTDAQVADSKARQDTLAAKAGTGISGDMTGSAPLVSAGQAAGAEQERARTTLNTAAAQTPIVASRAAAIQLSDIGSGQARHATIEGDYNKQSQTIFNGKLKLNSDRAAAQVKEYSDLLGTEMDKASANRDSAALRDQLQSKADIAAQQHSEFLLGQKGLDSRANLAASTTRRGQTMSADQRAADRAARASQATLDRQVRLDIANKGNRSKLTGPAAQKASRDAAAVVDTVADILRTQQHNAHGKAGSGYLWDAKAQKYRPSRQVLIGMGLTSPQINAGLAHARGKLLTPQQKAALGIL